MWLNSYAHLYNYSPQHLASNETFKQFHNRKFNKNCIFDQHDEGKRVKPAKC